MRDRLAFASRPQLVARQSPSDLECIADHISNASDCLSAVRHHVCLFADMALTVADSTKVMRLDAAAMGEVMAYFTAQLEDSIEALATAHAIAVIIDEQSQEKGR